MTQQKPIRLYDSQTSPNCHRVKVVLEEKRLPLNLCLWISRPESKRSQIFFD